jgi:hypothetical protein
MDDNTGIVVQTIFSEEPGMWKKAVFVGLVSLGTLGMMGCHEHHHRDDEAAMTEDNEKNQMQMTVDQLPPKVVKTVQKHVPDGTIVSAETMIWNGKTIYEIDVKSGDTVYELKVHENGKYISKNVDKD